MLMPLLLGQNFSPLTAPHGMVVSDHRLASEIGRDAMRRGGNAVDAAVATAFALAVTHPAAGNLGGGGFMMVRMASGQAVAIDFRETAPTASTRDMYLAEAKDSTVGYRAVGIPGTPAGLWEAHRRFGKLGWKTLVEPARKLAAAGFPLSRELAGSLEGQAKSFRVFPESYRQFNREGRFFRGGEVWRQPTLAATLGRLKDGPGDFYRGKTARLLADAMRANGGLITLADLSAYKPIVRAPLKGMFNGYEVSTMPPPSSGGIALLQMLGTVEGRLGAFGSSETVHPMIEAMKHAFADRAEFLGDPAFVSVPVDELLSKGRIEGFRAALGPQAVPSDRIKPKLDSPQEGNNTTHFTVVDGAGNAVSCTTTLNTSYGSGVTVAGFLLNNEMDDFASAPGRPNAYGLIQGEANAIQPGKRPLSSMTPTFLAKDGKLFLALGSPGGPTIINTVFQTILNITVHGMDVQRAVTAPRFHHQWRPDAIAWEPYAFSTDLQNVLRAKGHVLNAGPATMGSCQAVMVLPDGWRSAGLDPRLPDAGASGN
ncbi:gamma-glutamyltransferase [bacterium]|nr:MAG: gamma-glutamyltransferase [bacterium]